MIAVIIITAINMYSFMITNQNMSLYYFQQYINADANEINIQLGIWSKPSDWLRKLKYKQLK